MMSKQLTLFVLIFLFLNIGLINCAKKIKLTFYDTSSCSGDKATFNLTAAKCSAFPKGSAGNYLYSISYNLPFKTYELSIKSKSFSLIGYTGPKCQGDQKTYSGSFFQCTYSTSTCLVKTSKADSCDSNWMDAFRAAN